MCSLHREARGARLALASLGLGLPSLGLALPSLGLGLLSLGLVVASPAAQAAETHAVRLDYGDLAALVASPPAPAANKMGAAATTGLALFAAFRQPGWDLLAHPGAPALPARAEQIVLPAGMVATGVRARSLAAVRIPAPALPAAQPPAILVPAGMTLPPPAIVPPDPAIYDGTALYPAELAVFRASGRFADLNIAACEVHPIQYDPVARELILHREIELTLEITPDPGAAAKAAQASSARPRAMDTIARAIARSTMRGAEDLTLPAKAGATGRATAVDPTAYEYVIVTTEAQAPAYQQLAAWKTQKGVPATVVTTRWINENMTGVDPAARIRSFIQQAVADWGTSYVLLAADEWLVPSRVTFAFDSRARLSSDENDLYADLYYSDLDGTWDDNRNGIYGEVGDQVDLYPDVFVGRSPTGDVYAANAVVQKLVYYDKNLQSLPNTETVFFAEVLWQDPFTDAGVGKDMIADRYAGLFPGPITRLYETFGNESVATVTEALNRGPLLANHDGHAFHNVMGVGDGYFRNANADLLLNGGRPFVLFSIGCWAAAFDYDSIAEHFYTNRLGGAVAFIGNSRYGWGSPGNPGWGYSETFDSDFYGALLAEGLTELGPAVAWPKILRIPYSQDANVYRWHQYQVNLLGDPEMTAHLAETVAMTVEAPAFLPAGASEFTATVSDLQGPVAGAELCLAGDAVYQIGTSDELGQVAFHLDMPAAGVLTLTATAPNRTFVEQRIAAGDTPLMVVAAVRMDDDATAPSAGNGDGEIAAGETIELYVTIANRGRATCRAVQGTLAAADPHLELLTEDADFGDVPAGGEATNATPLVLRASGDGPAQAVHILPIDLRDGDGRGIRASIPIDVVAPGTRLDHVTAAVVVGDTDAAVEPGETVALTVHVRNSGRGRAAAVTAGLHATSPGLRVRGGLSSTAGDLAPGAVAALDPPFEVTIDGGCAIPACIALALELDDATGKRNETIHLAIGDAGFATDFEGGPGGFAHAGAGDSWRLETNRAHSGATSWYCGSDEFRYADNADCSLMSPEFVVPPEAEISFWCYFDVTIYGSDGLYIEARDGDTWRTLSYLGSGGALDGLLFAVRWAEHVVPLPLAPGSTSQIRFRFQSDAHEVDEGFYLDDIAVRSRATMAIAAPAPSAPLGVTAASAHPIESSAAWRVALAAPGTLSARLYDLNGRLVREFPAVEQTAGVHELRWDGVTGWGEQAPAGIYFLRVEAGGQEAIQKIVKLPD